MSMNSDQHHQPLKDCNVVDTTSQNDGGKIEFATYGSQMHSDLRVPGREQAIDEKLSVSATEKNRGTAGVGYFSEAAEKEIANTGSFIERLYLMLQHAEIEGFEDIVRWEPDGVGFKVHNAKAFEERIQPKYLKQTRLRSLQRKLVSHGFSRVQGGPARGAYKHDKFRRGHRSICLQIVGDQQKNHDEGAIDRGGSLDGLSPAAAQSRGVRFDASKDSETCGGTNKNEEINDRPFLLMVSPRFFHAAQPSHPRQGGIRDHLVDTTFAGDFSGIRAMGAMTQQRNGSLYLPLNAMGVAGGLPPLTVGGTAVTHGGITGQSIQESSVMQIVDGQEGSSPGSSIETIPLDQIEGGVENFSSLDDEVASPP